MSTGDKWKCWLDKLNGKHKREEVDKKNRMGQRKDRRPGG
jgi:hypothetical protein